MIWLAVIGLALAVFALLAWRARLSRPAWQAVGAALFAGLAGYAWQGHPALSGAPKAPASGMVAANASPLPAPSGPAGNWLVLADALGRNGQYGDAAAVLRTAARRDEANADVWVAEGNALVAHADGMVTPAAQYAFRRARALAPDHPGPPFFLGLGLAQQGRLAEARAEWAGLLRRSPPDAAYRRDLEARLARLDAMIKAQQAGQLPLR